LTRAENDPIISTDTAVSGILRLAAREAVMTVAEEVKAQLKVSRRVRNSIAKSPTRARRWLVEMGILQRDGKKLARRYR